MFERRTRDRKVAGSNPGMSGGGIFFSRVSFCADSHFDIRSTPMLLYYHVKDPGHSAKSAGGRFQVNTCALRMWLRINWHCELVCSGMVYTVHVPRQ